MHTQNGKEREMKILCFYNVEAEIDERFGLLLNHRQKWRPKSFPNILENLTKVTLGKGHDALK